MFGQKTKFKLLKRQTVNRPSISSIDNDTGGVDWVISIRGVIEDPCNYAHACDVLNRATDKDAVLIIINSPGGHVSSSIAICASIDNCEAVVTTRAVGTVASAGAFIWSSGNKLQACKFAKIMFHATSHGMCGATRDIKDTAEAIEELAKITMSVAVEKKLITEEQYKKAFDDKLDIYLNVNDLANTEADYELIG